MATVDLHTDGIMDISDSLYINVLHNIVDVNSWHINCKYSFAFKSRFHIGNILYNFFCIRLIVVFKNIQRCCYYHYFFAQLQGPYWKFCSTLSCHHCISESEKMLIKMFFLICINKWILWTNTLACYIVITSWKTETFKMIIFRDMILFVCLVWHDTHWY